MDSFSLNPETARAFTDAVRTRLRWFGRVRQRMERRGFPPTDPLYLAVLKCHDALQELHVRAHYASCKSGVGRSDDRSASR